MLAGGGSIGRALGGARRTAASRVSAPLRPCVRAEVVGQWTWIDPGAFALVGAGAFMGGVTRLTVALAVIMIEVSSDVHMLLPVLVAIMTVRGRCCGVSGWRTGAMLSVPLRACRVHTCAARCVPLAIRVRAPRRPSGWRTP